MAWSASGAERVKSYRVYKDLEAERNALQQQVRELQKEIARRDGLIRAMACELNSLAERLDVPMPTIPRNTVIEGGMTLPGSTMPSERLLPSDKGLPHGNAETPSEPAVAPPRPISGLRPQSPAMPHPSTYVGRYDNGHTGKK